MFGEECHAKRFESLDVRWFDLAHRFTFEKLKQVADTRQGTISLSVTVTSIDERRGGAPVVALK